MTKKNYQAIAAAIYWERCQNESIAKGDPTLDWLEVMRGITRAIGNVLAEDNPRFDRARFEEACETGQSPPSTPNAASSPSSASTSSRSADPGEEAINEPANQ